MPKILLALVTTVFSDVYKRICRWLTDRGQFEFFESMTHISIRVFILENYREQRVHDNQMIAKLFAVRLKKKTLKI